MRKIRDRALDLFWGGLTLIVLASLCRCASAPEIPPDRVRALQAQAMESALRPVDAARRAAVEAADLVCPEAGPPDIDCMRARGTMHGLEALSADAHRAIADYAAGVVSLRTAQDSVRDAVRTVNALR